MTITIAHLYYDLLNLCGECGNVRILKKCLEQQNINVEIKLLTIDDELDFTQYDLVYMGMGINDNLLLANNHIKKYNDEIKKAIENNKFFLCTGNSYELFGSKIDNNDCLGIFNFNSYTLEEKEVMEVDATTDYIDNKFIGFINKNSSNDNKNNNFLKIINGDNIIEEGIKYKNFIGTYTLGPILVRNPIFLEKIAKELISKKDSKFNFKPFNLKFLEDAYSDCLNRRKTNKN